MSDGHCATENFIEHKTHINMFFACLKSCLNCSHQLKKLGFCIFHLIHDYNKCPSDIKTSLYFKSERPSRRFLYILRSSLLQFFKLHDICVRENINFERFINIKFSTKMHLIL